MPPASPFEDALRDISPEQPVLIAGPTASGKSALALEIAAHQGGVIVNADASQVYNCWRIITARPSPEEEAAAPHALYGHVAATSPYSTGHWLRDVTALLNAEIRPIITGGTGLYFAALTQGLAEIPPTPAEVRKMGDQASLEELSAALDPRTAARIDVKNRARVQRAWEVRQATGRGLADWQDETGPPVLPVSDCYPLVFDTDKTWLNSRIAQRFDAMLKLGALEEIRTAAPDYNPTLPAHRAIGVPELMSHVCEDVPLEAAKESAIISTRQFAKRQRTWMRNKMSQWNAITPT